MSNFFSLISIENTKLWKRMSTKVMLILMVVIVLAATGIYKYYTVKNNISNTTTVSDSWKQDLQKKLVVEKAELDKLKNSTSKMEKASIGSIEKSVAEDEYSINNNIKPITQSSIWTRVTKFDGDAGYGQLIALFLIISCAALVAGEFSDGTMKMMISRPYRRFEILTAKLAATVIYGLALLGTAFVLTFLTQGIFFGFNDMGAKEMFWTSGSIIYIPAVLKTFIIFGLDFLQVLFYVIVAFALSAIFRSRSLATGFSLFILLVGGGIIRLLAMLFDWGKYLPFGMDNFSGFVTSGSYIQGTSLTFALVLTAIYAIVFAFAGYFVFQKRDI